MGLLSMLGGAMNRPGRRLALILLGGVALVLVLIGAFIDRPGQDGVQFGPEGAAAPTGDGQASVGDIDDGREAHVQTIDSSIGTGPIDLGPVIVFEVVGDGTVVPGAEVRMPLLTDSVGVTGVDGRAHFLRSSLKGMVGIAWAEACTASQCSGVYFDVSSALIRIDLDRGGFEWTEGVVVDQRTGHAVDGVVVSIDGRDVATADGGKFGLWLASGEIAILETLFDGRFMGAHSVAPGAFATLFLTRRLPLSLRVWSELPATSAVVVLSVVVDGETRQIEERLITSGDTLLFATLPSGDIQLDVRADGFMNVSRPILERESLVEIELSQGVQFRLQFPSRADDSVRGHYVGADGRSSTGPGSDGGGFLAVEEQGGNVFISSAALIGSGVGSIFGQTVVGPSQRELDLSSLDLFECTFKFRSSSMTEGLPASVTMRFHDDIVPNMPTRWIGRGTGYGASRFIKFDTDERGELRVLLPKCRISLSGWSSVGAPIGEAQLDIIEDGVYEIAVPVHVVSARLRVIRQGSPASGVRVRLRGKPGVEAVGVSGSDGIVLLREIVPGPYVCDVEGPWGVITPSGREIVVGGDAIVDVPVAEPSRVQVIPGSDAPSGSLIYVLARNPSRLLFGKRSASRKSVVFESYLDEGFEMDLGPGSYEFRTMDGLKPGWFRRIVIGDDPSTRTIIVRD